ncbi:hypothetical protein QAD02_024251 [Eretmocerus hayati]|uniref:Uncharacterized protein n=1 Tax=Eretmocerus hayati TaxID=131215 RepID=A0ACC2PZW3_9HYME|nr:hypothetical protein QAD02_024251 [Eretmocerus hayati]
MASQNGSLASKENTNSSNTKISHVQASYANAASAQPRPGKDQALIIEAIQGYTNDDYIDGLEKLLDPREIEYISKITGNRICVFLSNKNLAAPLTTKKVQVVDHSLDIKSLIEQNKKVIISNVNPVLPNQVIINALKNHGVNPVSSITELRASLKPNRAHIRSFRRQAYVTSEEEQLVPKSLQVQYDNMNYWIYFTTESTGCYICQQSGHIARICSSTIQQTESNFPALVPNGSEPQLSAPTNSTTITPAKDQEIAGKHDLALPLKRPLQSTSSSEATPSPTEDRSVGMMPPPSEQSTFDLTSKQNKPLHKKKKGEDDDMHQMDLALEKEAESAPSTPFNVAKFHDKFLQELHELGLHEPYDVDQIVLEPNIEACKSMIKFLRKCELKV